jgi:hypothetical protein
MACWVERAAPTQHCSLNNAVIHLPICLLKLIGFYNSMTGLPRLMISAALPIKKEVARDLYKNPTYSPVFKGGKVVNQSRGIKNFL